MAVLTLGAFDDFVWVSKPDPSPSPKTTNSLETVQGTVLLQKDDGNCLYRSISAGLALQEDVLRKNGKWDLDSVDVESRHTTLRERTINWMKQTLENDEDFSLEAYLIASIDDTNESRKKIQQSGTEEQAVLINERLGELTLQIQKSIYFIEKYSRLLDSKDKKVVEESQVKLHASLDILKNSQKEYGELVDVLSNLKKEPSSFLAIESNEDYLQEASKNGFFAGLAEVYSLAQMYEIDIAITYTDSQHTRMYDKQQVEISGGPEGIVRPKIHLEYFNDNHYNTLIPYS